MAEEGVQLGQEAVEGRGTPSYDLTQRDCCQLTDVPVAERVAGLQIGGACDDGLYRLEETGSLGRSEG